MGLRVKPDSCGEAVGCLDHLRRLLLNHKAPEKEGRK